MLHASGAEAMMVPLRAPFFSPLRCSFSLLCVALSLGITGAARADEKTDLEKGRNAFLTRQYVEAEARFRTMLDPATGSLKSAELINEARMYWGAVSMAMHRGDDAEALFARVIRQNPEYQPDPLTFTTEVLDKFTDTRSRLKDEINAQKAREARDDADRKAREAAEKQKQQERLKVLERLAAQETVTTTHSRWVAMLPFGAGQFQNGRQGAGAFFALSEGALVVASAVTFVVFLGQRAQAAALFSDSGAQYNQATATAYNGYTSRANTTRVVNLAIDGALVSLAAAGIIEAQVRYQADVTITRPRALPAAWLAPSLAPSREGGVAGATLTVGGDF